MVIFVVSLVLTEGDDCDVVGGVAVVGGIWLKLAVMVLLRFMVIVVLAEVGLATGSPVQLTNCQLDAGVAECSGV